MVKSAISRITYGMFMMPEIFHGRFVHCMIVFSREFIPTILSLTLLTASDLHLTENLHTPDSTLALSRSEEFHGTATIRDIITKGVSNIL